MRSSSPLELHPKFHAEKKPYEFYEYEVVKSTTIGRIKEKYEIIFP